jgi:RNA polymerase sigma factor (sigma-70 family)
VVTDSGQVTPNEEETSSATLRSGEGTGLTWPPELPFGFALERARELDRSALGMLYRRFLPVVYRYVLARVGAVSTAEDVTSETFAAVVEGIQTMQAHDELSFASWVLGIARHKVAMHFRRLHTGPGAPESLVEVDAPATAALEGDPLAVVTARESWADVVAGLNLLTEEQRTVIVCRCVLGYSTQETADLMDKQPGAVRALQFRALGSLARHLGIAGEMRQHSLTSTREGGLDQ